MFSDLVPDATALGLDAISADKRSTRDCTAKSYDALHLNTLWRGYARAAVVCLPGDPGHRNLAQHLTWWISICPVDSFCQGKNMLPREKGYNHKTLEPWQKRSKRSKSLWLCAPKKMTPRLSIDRSRMIDELEWICLIGNIRTGVSS